MALQDFFNIANYRQLITGGQLVPYDPEVVIKLRNFKNDFVTYSQTGNSDLNWIKFGFRKPWRQIYFDIVSPYTLPGIGRSFWYYSTGANTINLARQYINDETATLKNSGFVQIKTPPGDWAPDSNGDYSLLIWCRRQDPSAGEVSWQIPMRGVNYIFSDDNDLERVRADIVDASNNMGWGPKHVLARDFIMQQLRKKFDQREISAFDILNPWELREASTFLALSFIYKYELSKSPGDVFDMQAKSFYEKFYKSFDMYELAIDTDGDGKFTDQDQRLVGDDMISSTSLEWT